jgi:hypothetical protein
MGEPRRLSDGISGSELWWIVNQSLNRSKPWFSKNVSFQSSPKEEQSKRLPEGSSMPGSSLPAAPNRISFMNWVGLMGGYLELKFVEGITFLFL